MGSNIDPIVKNAPCKVALIKPHSDIIGDTVAFIGTGPHSITALKRAVVLTRDEPGSSLTLVNIQSRNQNMTEEKIRMKGEFLLRQVIYDSDIGDADFKQEVILTDDPREEMLKKSNEYNTVLIGASRSSGIERALFGTFPEYLGENAKANVIIIRGRERSFRSGWHLLRKIYRPKATD